MGERNGRSGEIRTPDPLVPNQMRYQAALHSEALRRIRFQTREGNPRNEKNESAVSFIGHEVLTNDESWLQSTRENFAAFMQK